MSRKKKSKNQLRTREEWDLYDQDDDITNFRRLCRDLGIKKHLPSKTQCHKALRSVHVNIRQFLDARLSGEEIKFFRSAKELAVWTAAKKSRRFALPAIPDGSPLRELLRKSGEGRGGSRRVKCWWDTYP